MAKSKTEFSRIYGLEFAVIMKRMDGLTDGRKQQNYRTSMHVTGTLLFSISDCIHQKTDLGKILYFIKKTHFDHKNFKQTKLGITKIASYSFINSCS